jgi:succinylarginine dihydrolase
MVNPGTLGRALSQNPRNVYVFGEGDRDGSLGRFPSRATATSTLNMIANRRKGLAPRNVRFAPTASELSNNGLLHRSK